MAEQDKKTTAAKAEKADGSWVVIDDQKQVLAVERSELRAWRIAGPLKATVVRWEFGKLRAEVLS